MRPAAAPPVVFLGPSCPVEDVRARLPDALILPPVRRGDLYCYRILRHTLFVIVDGVFASSPAISPREVVDVLNDGAMIVGASSMGALRAADCAPAGAIGVGEIYRLFRRGIVTSEDEVAVLFAGERPYPPVTEPLVNMRIALRRAVRVGVLGASEANAVLEAAESLHYTERTWPNTFAKADVRLPQRTEKYLHAIDTKRSDARKAIEWVARHSTSGLPLPESVANGADRFGLDGEGRERAPDPLDGGNRAQIMAEYRTWLAVSGYGQELAPADRVVLARAVDPASAGQIPEADAAAVCASVDAEALLVQFCTHRKALQAARRHGLVPQAEALDLADTELSRAHRVPSWSALLSNYDANPLFQRQLLEYRHALALTKTWKEGLFSAPPAGEGNCEDLLVWHRI